MQDFTVITNEEEKRLVERFRKEKQFPEHQYLHALEDILNNGVKTSNRTGIDCLTLPHLKLTFDMSDGTIPLLTHRKMAIKTFKVELEGFIRGITDKGWYKDNGCNIWNEWCNPKKVPYGHSEQTKKMMMEENDLGKIYGHQWRNFNSQGFDQLKWIVDELKTNKTNRQLVCSAWNPIEKCEQSLPPCHVLWNVFVVNDSLNMCWFQRSCDFPCGIGANIFSYSLLLHLLCKETGLKPGKISGFLSNCHIYENQIDGAREAIKRSVYDFPTVKTDNFTSIFDWCAKDTDIIGYKSGDKISYPIAV